MCTSELCLIYFFKVSLLSWKGFVGPLSTELGAGQAAGQTEGQSPFRPPGGVLAGQVLPECPGELCSFHLQFPSPTTQLFPWVFPFWLCWPQARYHLCSAGWLDAERVGYPTGFSSPNCGSGYVGIVDYGRRVNLSETWDVFCYREKGKRVVCHIPLCKQGQQPRFWFLPSATGCYTTLQETLPLF